MMSILLLHNNGSRYAAQSIGEVPRARSRERKLPVFAGWQIRAGVERTRLFACRILAWICRIRCSDVHHLTRTIEEAHHLPCFDVRGLRFKGAARE